MGPRTRRAQLAPGTGGADGGWPPRRKRTRADRLREARGRRKRRMAGGLALGILVVVVIGVVFLGSKLWHNVFGTSSDFTGDGVNDVVIQVHDGDSTTAIGNTLQDEKVVANSATFVEAAQGNAAISSIQPGFTRCAPRSRPPTPLSGLQIRRTGLASW